MVDAHVHLERGPYTSEWVEQFIQTAINRDIGELYLLEHSHRFLEFRPLYDAITSKAPYSRYQTEWFLKRNTLRLSDYVDFIKAFDKSHYPITIHFGLEICFFEGKESLISNVQETYNFDFTTGSVHWLDGWGFDHPTIQDEWKNRDVNHVYQQYYSQMNTLIESGLFTHLAHPDSIKCFNYFPAISLEKTYRVIAKKLKSHNMKVENSAGLHINYHHSELGMNEDLLRICREENCDIITASDAHRPEDVGRCMKELAEKTIFRKLKKK